MAKTDIMTMKVKADTIPWNLGSSLLRFLKDGKTVRLHPVGAECVNISVKGVIHANQYQERDGLTQRVIMIPYFYKTIARDRDTGENKEITPAGFYVYLMEPPC